MPHHSQVHDPASQQVSSGIKGQTESSDKGDERATGCLQMTAVTKVGCEEKDGMEGNIIPNTLSVKPSWSFSFTVGILHATIRWFMYVGLFFRRVLSLSHVSQAVEIAPKPQFWRVMGIENGDRLQAQEWLQKVSPGRHSLAEVSAQELYATLTMFGTPKSALDGWLVDRAFLGITPLSTPADAVVDVVAITGLGGHAMGSFRSTDGSFVWLRDVLPKTLPKARILTYGYDTALVKNKSKESVRDLAKVFLDTLAGFRYRTKTQQRPLCFVGHSLGGVVLKEALAIADLNQDADPHEIVLSTYGLILLGVPNLGLRHPQLMTMVEGNPNQQFVRDLVVDEDEAPSPYLDELTAKFSRVCSRVTPPFHIVSYYETERSPTVKVSTAIIVLAQEADVSPQATRRIALRNEWRAYDDGDSAFCRTHQSSCPRCGTSPNASHESQGISSVQSRQRPSIHSPPGQDSEAG
jgi:surfactin synthase thioesterase subunit